MTIIWQCKILLKAAVFLCIRKVTACSCKIYGKPCDDICKIHEKVCFSIERLHIRLLRADDAHIDDQYSFEWMRHGNH